MNLFSADRNGLDEQQLSSRWRWINEPSVWRINAAGEITIEAPALADFFRDPSGESIRATAPFLYTEVTGDFTVSTRVEVEMKAAADSACLMVMVDETHWAKLCFESCYDQPTIVSVVTKGTSDDCNSQALEHPTPILRATRRGQTMAFHYSLDGQYWVLVRYFHFQGPETIKVGVVAQSPVGDGSVSTFYGFNYADTPVMNLRTGE